MTNDTTTLNGALTELGETMADNLVSMGVVDADAGDGLTTLAGKILTIEPSIGGLDLDTAITLTSSSASITLGGSVVLTSKLTASYDDETLVDVDLEGVLTGATVSFMNGNTVIGTGVTDVNGIATYTYTPAASGTLSLKAVFAGTDNFDDCESSAITVSVIVPVPDSITLSADKSVLSYYDSESATLSVTVLDEDSQPCAGETVEFFNGSTSMGTAVTNTSGVATKSYSSTGAGDVTFTAEVGNLVSESYVIEDCYYANLTEQTITNSSVTVYSAMATGLETLMSGKWQLEFDMMSVSSGYDGDLNIGVKSQYTPSLANYRLSIGMDENKIHFNNRTTTSSNSTSSTRSRNTYYTLKLVRNGTSVVAYSNDTQFASKTVNWLGNYNEYDLYFIGWSSCNVKLRNIKVKPIS